jgi:hypothetical protein
MNRSRLIAAAIAIVSGAASVLFTMGVAKRVAEHHRRNPPALFAFKVINRREFGFAGRTVTLSDDFTNPQQPYLLVRYGDNELRLRVTVPGDYRLPDLLPHTDWMRVLAFAPAGGMSEEEFLRALDEKENSYRLVIVTRTPRAGVDPRTFGAAWQRDWYFDFHEFKRDGTFEHQRLKYPSRGGARKPVEGELQENTWQLQAALHLMPKAGGVGPTRNFYGDALSTAGWYLPGAAFTGAACVFSLAFAFAPRRRTT